MQLIECIPNFSEGRNPETISAIVESIKKIPQIKVLDQSSDFDHNRSVITFIGPPQAVVDAAFESAKTAQKLIDLTRHQGTHPRIGATDVIPLVPLQNINAEQTLPYAKKLAKKLFKELEIPTYLYEFSAKNPKNKNLADIRNKKPGTLPDFGKTPHPTAGETVIGVRDFLIAFNINLKPTSNNPKENLKIAKKIASKIRESSGGLPKVKALGMYLEKEKLAQVSTNLTNFRTTSPKQVFYEVQKLAQKYNTEILESELIGLIPDQALENTSAKELMIKNFNSAKVLETNT